MVSSVGPRSMRRHFSILRMMKFHSRLVIMRDIRNVP
jgi:hypothetical protein